MYICIYINTSILIGIRLLLAQVLDALGKVRATLAADGNYIYVYTYIHIYIYIGIYVYIPIVICLLLAQVLDALGKVRATLAADGTVRAPSGAVLAYIERDGSVGSASLEYFGEVRIQQQPRLR